MLLKCGSWSKKIEVAKASRGEEISVNLISSEYGNHGNNFAFHTTHVSTIYSYILCIIYIIKRIRIGCVIQYKVLYLYTINNSPHLCLLIVVQTSVFSNLRYL